MYQLLAEPALVQSVVESARQAVIALLAGAAVGAIVYVAIAVIRR